MLFIAITGLIGLLFGIYMYKVGVEKGKQCTDGYQECIDDIAKDWNDKPDRKRVEIVAKIIIENSNWRYKKR